MNSVYDLKIYSNKGNAEVISEVPAQAKKILDVGCGAGDNARILKRSGKYVVGLTISPSEALLAQQICDKVIVGDIENLPVSLNEHFDCIIMSHICEHLVNPAKAITKLSQNLSPGGCFVIAFPNMAYYKLRLRLLNGNWNMEETGPFDKTHLHFYSYNTAQQVYPSEDLTLSHKMPGQLAVPLWFIRRLLPSASRKLDHFIGKLFPNLFSMQVVLVYKKNNEIFK